MDEVAKEGAMLDGRFVAQAGVSTVPQEREEVFAALQYAASFCCLVEELKDCEEFESESFVQQKREACVVLERETEMKTEGPLVKAVPVSGEVPRRKVRAAQRYQNLCEAEHGLH